MSDGPEQQEALDLEDLFSQVHERLIRRQLTWADVEALAQVLLKKAKENH